MANAVLEAVEAALGSHRSLLVAVSGGMDSVVLLHALLQLRDKLSLRLEAAHVEHGIRGEESLEDMRFVEALCCQWEVPLSLRRLDVPSLARERGMNLEQAARLARYQFMEETRAARGLETIVTAHHLDDQAETVLLHLIRGSALKGLCGMSTESGTLLRPMLLVGREEIAAYAKENALCHREDSTNCDVRYARNRVRAKVMPEIQQINPSVSRSIARCALTLQEDESYLQEQAQLLYEKSKRGKGLKLDANAPRPLRMRALYAYLEDMGEEDVDQNKLTSLDRLLNAQAGERASVGKRLFESANGWVYPVEEARPFFIWVGESGTYKLPDGAKIRIGVISRPKSLIGSDTRQFFSARTLGFPMLLRSRRDGDRIEPFGMEGSKLLSDAMTDKKLPRHFRDKLPLVEKDGKLLFVPKVRRSKHFPVEKDDEQVIVIEYIEV